ncbi:MAG TPA: PQQ-dependent sugar dehydrogenase, partial [Flavitalea sp.]|nr:PQQ-dependent sugar dehydrogenase [Flavitalea sp.]
MKKYTLIPGLAAVTLIITSCHSSVTDRQMNGRDPDPVAVSSTKADTLYKDLNNPWGMVWLPDGRMLITEKAGEILVFRDGKFTGEKLTGVPEVADGGQGGLLDIKLHPDYEKNKWIYISYAKPVQGGATTTIMRFMLEGNNLVSKKELYEAKPYLDADFHFGSRIAFDKDNYLFFTSGERGTMEKVWELNNDHGKIHRLKDDGAVPDDNPFVKTPGAHPSIWSYGHRNPQGLVYDRESNRLWGIEHGPRGGDELNLIQKGKNYGWPKTCYGINYDGTILTDKKEMPGVTNPTHYWVPSIGPCGSTIVTSDKYPAWKGNLLIGALALKHIARVQLNGTTYVTEE